MPLTVPLADRPVGFRHLPPLRQGGCSGLLPPTPAAGQAAASYGGRTPRLQADPQPFSSPAWRRNRHVNATTTREVVRGDHGGDPAGIAIAYDSYAAALYGYSHRILHESAGPAAGP